MLIDIDDTGIHAMRQDEILAYLQATWKGIFGTGIDLSTETTDGQLIGILSEVWSDLVQAAVQIYNARSPAGATGAALARLVKLNGVTKKDPAPSSGVVTLTGTPAQVIVAGLRIGNAQPGVTATFVTTADATIGGGGTVTGVPVVSTVNGPIPGSAGDLSVILTPVPGLASVTNPADVVLGTVGETDAQLRARRTASVALPSQGIVDGLEAALLQIDGVTQAVVRENPEDTVQTLGDGGTLAPHAIQVIVQGGAAVRALPSDPPGIADVIWLKRSAGCTMVGATTATVTDVYGVNHTIKFDRPTAAPIYVAVHATPALSGPNQILIKQAIEDLGNGLLKVNDVPLPGSKIGKGVVVSDIYRAITVLSVTTIPGLQVGEIDISLSASLTSDASIVLNFDQIATWASSRVTFP